MSSESELSRLINLFAQAEEVIEKEVLRAEVRGAEYTASQRRARRSEISQILASLQELAIGGNPEEPTGPLWNMVRDAYREGSDAAIKDLEGLKQPVSSRTFNQLHQDAAEVIYENLRNRMTDAVGYVGRRVDDVFRKATLREVMAAQITGATTGETAKGIEEELGNRGVRAFQDTRGREWKLSTYARMAAKTTKTEATTMGNLNRIAENGIDLVQVIEHPGSCEICKPFEGKVYSISGQNERYPPLREAPPYHPNCSHLVAAHIEGLSEEPPGVRMTGGGGSGSGGGGRAVTGSLDPDDAYRRARDEILPGGKPIGRPGKRGDEKIRQIEGGEARAREIFDVFRRVGESVEDPNYEGEAVRLPRIGRVGLRRESGSGEPTIDVYATIEGVKINKLKFLE